MTATARPGEWVDHAPGLDDLAGSFNLRVSTDRYRSREYADRERDAIWLKTWQVAGRVDDLPKVGDWMEYKIYDQSFLIVRGRTKLRGFVNACRHRGNAICQGRTGNAKRGFLCQYHLWSYDLDGRLKGLLREGELGRPRQERQLAHRRVGGHLRRLHLHQPGPRCPARWWSGSARTRWRSWRPTTSN